MINVSPTAATKINELLAEEKKTGSHLVFFDQQLRDFGSRGRRDVDHFVVSPRPSGQIQEL